MSSTTRRRGERGQVLPLFALSATAIFILAALAFDTGLVLVEQRDQQNAADAAALAGARFLPGDTGMAYARAEAVATTNGFTHGANSATVTIHFGSWSPGSGFTEGTGTGAIDVRISANRGSIFAGIIGRNSWTVSSHAVAVNETTTSGPFAMMSINATACPGFEVSGSGTINSNGNIQVNSNCTAPPNQAFRIGGTGTLNMTGTGIGCNVVGGATSGGGVALNDCATDGQPANTGQPFIPDPYLGIGDPDAPALAARPRRWDPVLNIPHSTDTAPPTRCPNSGPPSGSDALPWCAFGGSYTGQTWRLHPGYYPGGLRLSATGATFYLEPGVYYMAGGGFNVTQGTLLSVATGGQTLGGGVLLFNGQCREAGLCTSTTAPGTPAPGALTIDGSNAMVNLLPLVGTGTYADYDNFVIYQDRDVTSVVGVRGGSADMSLRGIIYAPTARLTVNGGTGTLTLDQAIADTILVNGDIGTININYDQNFLPSFRYAGLTE